MDVLGLVEMEVFKERRIWGPRKALVKVGQPLDLKDRAVEYAANRRQAVEDVTATLETSVRKMLESMDDECALVRESN